MTPRRLRAVAAATLAITFLFQLRAASPVAENMIPALPLVYASESPAAAWDSPSFDSIIHRDPLEALRLAHQDHQRAVREYTCTFVKQELLPSGLSPEQVIAVKFRARPYSVMMHWLRNADKADRVIYVQDRWVDADADDPAERDLAVCQPGPIARLLVKSLKMPIRGSLARMTSRRCIDEFGFDRSMELLIRYSEIARQRGELSLTYQGESEFGGRPTYVIERRLPYDGPGGIYPDRVAVIHLDRERRIPLCVRCFADDERSHLLGRYEYRDVDLSADLPDDAFDPAAYGM
jgi:hypothetical protein